MTINLFFDITLVLMLIATALWAVLGRNLFRCIVLFITYGLLLSISWVRLDAPDIALAEAAIGAGLMGFLLLDTLGYIREKMKSGQTPVGGTERHRPVHVQQQTPPVHRITAGLLALMFAVLMVLAVIEIDRAPSGLTGEVEASMDISGVEHPVTAVLLNFRSYDTWLELGVLFLGLMGIYAIRGRAGIRRAPSLPAGQPLVQWLVRLLIPLMVLIGGYLLWLGKFASGGAFQSGVVLGSIGVLLWLSGKPSLEKIPGIVLKWAVLIGFMAFLLLAYIPLIAGDVMLTYPRELAGILILAVELCATISIAAILAAMLIAMQPASRREGPA